MFYCNNYICSLYLYYFPYLACISVFLTGHPVCFGYISSPFLCVSYNDSSVWNLSYIFRTHILSPYIYRTFLYCSVKNWVIFESIRLKNESFWVNSVKFLYSLYLRRIMTFLLKISQVYLFYYYIISYRISLFFILTNWLKNESNRLIFSREREQFSFRHKYIHIFLNSIWLSSFLGSLSLKFNRFDSFFNQLVKFGLIFLCI